MSRSQNNDSVMSS